MTRDPATRRTKPNTDDLESVANLIGFASLIALAAGVITSIVLFVKSVNIGTADVPIKVYPFVGLAVEILIASIVQVLFVSLLVAWAKLYASAVRAQFQAPMSS